MLCAASTPTLWPGLQCGRQSLSPCLAESLTCCSESIPNPSHLTGAPSPAESLPSNVTKTVGHMRAPWPPLLSQNLLDPRPSSRPACPASPVRLTSTPPARTSQPVPTIGPSPTSCSTDPFPSADKHPLSFCTAV